MDQTRVSVYQLSDVPTPLGWKYAQMGAGLWSAATLTPTKLLIRCADGDFDAITGVVQGGLLFEQPQEWFGVPTQNTPIIDVVYCPSQPAIFRVLEVIDPLNIVVSNPSGIVVSERFNWYGLCSRYNPVTSIDIDGFATTYNASFLDGTSYTNAIVPFHGFFGTPLEPILLNTDSPDLPVATITR